MIPKIVFLDDSTIGTVNNIHLISQLGNYIFYPHTKPSQTIERMKDCHIVITNKVVIDKSIIDASSALKLICVAATGMNNVDMEYAAKKGIQVKNVAGYSTDSVAQHTFAMLLQLISKLNFYDKYVKEGSYTESHIFTHYQQPFFELKGKKLGIVGFGSIGRKVASIAEAFGAIVVYYSTTGKNENNEFKRVDFNELLSTCDIISVHCPLNEKTFNIIDENQFKIMKPNAIIINVARGGIINEKALANALDQHLISAAAVDVFTSEPIKNDNPLLNIKSKDHLLLTPHIAWTSLEARHQLVEKISENIKEFLKSTPIS